MFSFTHLKRKNQKSVQYARPTVPGPIWVPIAGLTSDNTDSTAFNFAEAFSKTDLALASAFACKVARRMLDLPAHFSATNSITRSCALLSVRARSAESTMPPLIVRMGFMFIAEPSNHCAPQCVHLYEGIRGFPPQKIRRCLVELFLPVFGSLSETHHLMRHALLPVPESLAPWQLSRCRK